MTTIAQTRSAGAGSARRLRRRHLWLMPGLGLALVASTQATHLGVGLAPLLLFGIVPHLTVLAGIGQPHRKGQLGPRAVPTFNLMHQPLLPTAVFGLAATGFLPPFWLVGALTWLGHIVVDHALGDGMRGAEGFLRTRATS